MPDEAAKCSVSQVAARRQQSAGLLLFHRSRISGLFLASILDLNPTRFGE